MESKRIRFGLTYKGSVCFTKDILGESVDVRSIECVTVDEIRHVLITLNKPRYTVCIVNAIKQYNEANEDRIELIAHDGVDIIRPRATRSILSTRRLMRR